MWAGSHTCVISVHPTTGLVTAQAVGTTTITATVEDMLIDLKATWGRTLGIGCVQWTGTGNWTNRALESVKIYKEVAQADSITKTQASIAEGLMMDRELDGTLYKGYAALANIYPDWKKDHSGNLHSEEAAYDAGYVLASIFKGAGTDHTIDRANRAKMIYNLMVSES